MKKELDQKLCEKYPKIFADRGKNMMESCMYWGLAVEEGWYDIIDVLCNSIQQHIDQSVKDKERNEKHNAMVIATRAGDLSLFNEAKVKLSEEWKAKYLAEILDASEDGTYWSRGIRLVKPVVEQVVAEQVKEKFGGLRFYYRGGDEYIRGLVSFAESMSYRVCEDCGKPGTVGGRGWIRTLCSDHIRPGEEDSFKRKGFAVTGGLNE